MSSGHRPPRESAEVAMRRETIEEAAATVVDPVVAVREALAHLLALDARVPATV
jgi:8-oxo-dGTP pyrophosphatase MutT (NUDIX family)